MCSKRSPPGTYSITRKMLSFQAITSLSWTMFGCSSCFMSCTSCITSSSAFAASKAALSKICSRQRFQKQSLKSLSLRALLVENWSVQASARYIPPGEETKQDSREGAPGLPSGMQIVYTLPDLTLIATLSPLLRFLARLTFEKRPYSIEVSRADFDAFVNSQELCMHSGVFFLVASSLPCQ